MSYELETPTAGAPPAGSHQDMESTTPSTDRPTRIAVVGCGFIADFHLDILRELEGVQVVAVCDPALGRAEDCASRYDVPNAVRSVAELAQHDIDVAHILAPPDLHVAITRELLELGIGVFVEKPLALAANDAFGLQALADEKKLPLAVNHNNLYHPAFERLVERVESGSIGRVEHVRVCLSVPLMQLDAGQYSHWMFRAPRNIVFEQAVHPFCQVHRLLGRVQDVNTKILSTRELDPGQQFHDRWLISAVGERGTAEVYLAFGQGFTRNTFEVIGSDGSLEADLFHNHLAGERKTLWLEFWNSFLAGWRRGGELRRDAMQVAYYWFRFTLGLGRREDAFFAGMRSSLREFYRELRAGEPLQVNGTSAAEVLEWCERAASVASDKAAETPQFPEPGEAREGEVVLLGGNGFIGRRVVTRLLGEGRNVTCVVRRMNNLPPEITEPALAGKLRLVRGTLEDSESIVNAVRGAKVVLQLATGNGDTWEAVERSMVQGSVAVAEACADSDVERMIYVSSVAALFTGAEETRELADSIATDPKPAARSLYSRGKIAAERALRDFAGKRGLALTIARPGIVVGEGTPMQHSGYGLWARDNHCVGWGLGETPLPLVWVDDVADALSAACVYEGSELDGRAWNLCSKVQLGGREVVEELRRSTGRDLHFHPRSLAKSQLMEIGKWLVKIAGRKEGVEFPSWRDLESRSLDREFSCRIARDVLGWNPVEEREAFLDRTVRIYAPQTHQQ